MVTNKSMYNIKYKTIQRELRFKDITGMTKSLSEGGREFVVHIKDQYDYRYSGSDEAHRDNIFKFMKENYHKVRGKNLIIYGVNDTNL